ncbi:uncharacterized protein [Penaeus vannamei]|uniref:uncharacterized protein n=1 Tax=Penaeus vannamei TaxID=6689 RepID=UPI00387F87D8
MQQDVYAAFIDYENVFDRVSHINIMKDLEEMGIDGKDIRVPKNLYWDQMAAISIDGVLSEWTQIKRGIPPKCKSTLDDEEQVENFGYLGSILTQECRCSSDIKTRIPLAKKSFSDMSNTFTNNKLGIETKKRMMKCYIWSILTYGCESWTLSKQDESRLEAMEMWIYRPMKKISWIEKKTNKQVLEMVGEERNLLKTIRQGQLRFVGHITREDSIEKLSLEGRAEGCRSRGRQRQDFLQGLAMVAGMKTTELLRLAHDRDGFKKMVANVRL